MARLLQTIIWNTKQMPMKIPSYNSYNIENFRRVFDRYLSRASKYKAVKLAYKLFKPKSDSDDRLSPLIFLHGITSSKEVTWGDLPQVIANQTKRKAYNLDARNHGDSEWSEEFDFDLNVADLLHFLDEMRIPKAVIIGHSMGGLTGYKAALKKPGRIEALFVEEMFVRKVPQAFMDDALSYMSVWTEAEQVIPAGVDRKEAENFITRYVLRRTHPQNVCSHQDMTPWCDISYPLRKESSGRYSFKANLKVILEKMKNGDDMMLETEGIYQGPSFFLYGTKSPYQVGKEKHHILKHFPNAVFVPFEGAKHFVHKEFPDQFAETVVKFIQQDTD